MPLKNKTKATSKKLMVRRIIFELFPSMFIRVLKVVGNNINDHWPIRMAVCGSNNKTKNTRQNIFGQRMVKVT
jgi:hypothetical protein